MISLYMNWYRLLKKKRRLYKMAVERILISKPSAPSGGAFFYCHLVDAAYDDH
ncbi:hypothetical protein [Bacillus sp. PK3_68]|uniref:hypothetical protein n=1 Tax=Bacillus sp. PK3_68 TaxID=2027408 RepID=UPI00160071A5|nr:hypothetical protein [Bacillus sp. PK3_68]